VGNLPQKFLRPSGADTCSIRPIRFILKRHTDDKETYKVDEDHAFFRNTMFFQYLNSLDRGAARRYVSYQQSFISHNR
jgi:hypothetical protein